MQRFCSVGVVLAALAFTSGMGDIQAIAMDDAVPRALAQSAAESNSQPGVARMHALERQLAEVKQVLAELRASNEDLKARVQHLTKGIGALSGGKVSRPGKPKLENLPEALPELKPLELP